MGLVFWAICEDEMGLWEYIQYVNIRDPNSTNRERNLSTLETAFLIPLTPFFMCFEAFKAPTFTISHSSMLTVLRSRSFTANIRKISDWVNGTGCTFLNLASPWIVNSSISSKPLFESSLDELSTPFQNNSSISFRVLSSSAGSRVFIRSHSKKFAGGW